ncbi:hypothetical protein U1Q18_000259 [Sarracenia purpurea var. burkii]
MDSKVDAEIAMKGVSIGGVRNRVSLNPEVTSPMKGSREARNEDEDHLGLFKAAREVSDREEEGMEDGARGRGSIQYQANRVVGQGNNLLGPRFVPGRGGYA